MNQVSKLLTKHKMERKMHLFALGEWWANICLQILNARRNDISIGDAGHSSSQ